jgi:hypothetical protein
LTTEYSANGSFYRPHTRSVHKAIAGVSAGRKPGS